jgi:hypothetical protein
VTGAPPVSTICRNCGQRFSGMNLGSAPFYRNFPEIGARMNEG